MQDLEYYLTKAASYKQAECRRRKLPCDVTFASLLALYRAQDGKCALSGRPLQWGQAGQQRDTLSIDRIEAGQGYVAGNIRLVTYQVNMARGQFSDDDLVQFCRDVLAHAPVSDLERCWQYPVTGVSAGLVM